MYVISIGGAEAEGGAETEGGETLACCNKRRRRITMAAITIITPPMLQPTIIPICAGVRPPLGGCSGVRVAKKSHDEYIACELK